MIETIVREIQEKFWLMKDGERERFSKLTNAQLNDLLHRSHELSHSEDYSLRVTAEIIRTRCLTEIEKR